VRGWPLLERVVPLGAPLSLWVGEALWPSVGEGLAVVGVQLFLEGLPRLRVEGVGPLLLHRLLAPGGQALKRQRQGPEQGGCG